MKSQYVHVQITLTLCFLVAAHLGAEEPSKPVDPSGTWRWEYDWNGETVKDSLRLNSGKEGEVAGVFVGRLGEVPIKAGKLEGTQLSFDVPMEFQGNSFTLNFSGNLKGDDIDGKVAVETPDGPREFPWTPKRSVTLDDVLGAWQLRIESPQGTVLEPTLKVTKDGDKFIPVYTSMQGQELDITGLRVANNQLEFTVTTEMDGNPLKVDFSGRPYGDKLHGTLDYDFAGQTGEAEFSGARKAEASKQ